MKIINTIIIMAVTIPALMAQRVEKSKQGSFLLKGGLVHTITKGNIEADVLLMDGKIADLGSNLAPTGNFTTIDCKGKHIYPGLIDAGTQLGLREIESVSVTNDDVEVGDFIPHMQALTAVNPNAVAIPVTRANGVTTVLTYPSGGKIPGTAAVIDLHGYTPEQMYAGAKPVVLNFPTSGRRSRFDRRSDEDIKKDSEKSMKSFNDLWANILLYATIDSAAKAENKVIETYQPDMAAMLDVVRKKQLLMIEVNKDSDIKAALTWLEGKNLNVVLTGVAEGYRVASEIAKSKYPVITGPITDLPRRSYDKYDSPYANAGIMLKAGIKVAIRTDEAENVRNLPFMAGFAAAYGMGTEEALKAVTIVPAQIFGIDKMYGSLEKGKVANVIVTTGDPFETKTQVEQIYIRGWQVPGESRQTLLYQEFLKRDQGK
jgi:imidazolonepropionase-like amidohydrolase